VLTGGVLLRQENSANAVVACCRQGDAGRGAFLAQEGIRDLHQNAGAVTGKRVGAHGATVGQVFKDFQALADDFMRLAPFNIGHEADTTGVVFVGGVVQALSGRQHAVHHGENPVVFVFAVSPVPALWPRGEHKINKLQQVATWFRCRQTAARRCVGRGQKAEQYSAAWPVVQFSGVCISLLFQGHAIVPSVGAVTLSVPA
jgi:hypothetical protein